ncbi:kinesin-like protein KIF14 [Lineus longissimus]|uniref:kinesin-like protein KIF14 n=1 Tax=Lineus longissimus TaxID=88925 RepID=UPI00315C794E
MSEFKRSRTHCSTSVLPCGTTERENRQTKTRALNPRTTSSRSVSFNPNIIETSFGGTQKVAKIKQTLNDSRGILVEDTNISNCDPITEETSSLEIGNTSARNSPKSRRTKSFPSGPSSAIPSRNQMMTSQRRLGQNGQGTGTPECFKSVQTHETPNRKSKDSIRRSTSMLYPDDFHGDSCGVTVAVRVRPFSKRELTFPDVKCIMSMDENETTVTSDNGTHRFTYDFSFWSFDSDNGEFASQDHVYNMLAQPLLGKAFEGYNTCLFAYGQTGSGKSYSVMGHNEEVGIIPRFSEELFLRREDLIGGKDHVSVNVEISFFEIYNEKIHDLLASSCSLNEKVGKRPILRVREHPVLGPYVEGLSTHVVNTFDDIQTWLNLGNKQRATAATGMNDKSSRSHSVFTVVLTQTKTDVLEGECHEHSTTSKINLIDLAGSERQSAAKTSGDRLKEGASINKSLHTLGKVISQLSELSSNPSKKKKVFIPYRDSVLTWLLKESLGGNSKTAMLATVSPANICLEETMSTLRYARQARTIVNTARINEDAKARLIRELRSEIEKLRSQTGNAMHTEDDFDAQAASLAEIASLKSKLLEKEKAMQEMSRSWQERLQSSEARKKEETKLLEKSGVTLKINNKLPNLVNLNEDPQLSEMLLYMLKPGQSQVGRKMTTSEHDIQLNGALIADDHCFFDHVDDVVYLIPINDALTYVNGDLITERITLHHGDRVILGGDHYFRFNNPKELKEREGRPNTAMANHVKDFEFARQELIRVQNARLEQELEETRKKAQEEMRHELESVKSSAKKELKEKLEKTRQQAAQELIQQKTSYEGRLAQLERELKAKEEQTHQDTEGIMKKAEQLERQNQLLQQTVIANKKRLELEAQAANQAVKNSKISHFKFFEKLENEKQKIQLDVKRLSELRSKKESATPVKQPLGQLTPLKIDQNGNRMDLYRNALLLREANKISQYLKRDTLFSLEEIPNDGQYVINVTNTKLGITTFWTLEKFEDKLVEFREAYQAEGASDVSDDLFYNPNDTWEQVERINSPTDSKRLRCAIRKSLSPKSPMILRKLSFNESDKVEMIVEEESPREKSLASSVFDICRELLSETGEKLKDPRLDDSIADMVLWDLDAIYSALSSLMDARSTVAFDINSTSSEQTQVQSIQLTVSMKQLVCHATSWAASYNGLGSPLIKSYMDKIIETMKKLSNYLVLFLQGYASDITTMVNGSSSDSHDALFSIAKQCGEVALATEMRMNSLVDSRLDVFDDEDEDTRMPKLYHLIKMSFLGGSDLFIDKTIQGGIKTVEDCELSIQTLGDNTGYREEIAEILQHVEILVASARVLLVKMQEIQVQVNVSMRESEEGGKPENYYDRSYRRLQGLVTQITGLSESVGLLCKAAGAVAGGTEKDLRRLIRGVEMITKSTKKLITISYGDSNYNSLDTQSESSEASILNDMQNELLDLASQEVQLSSRTLINYLQKQLESNPTYNCPIRGKRVLPPSPDRGVGIGGSNSVIRHCSIKQRLVLIDGHGN